MLNAEVKLRRSKATTSNLHPSVDVNNVEPLKKNWIGQNLLASSLNSSTNLQLWFNLKVGADASRKASLLYKRLNIS